MEEVQGSSESAVSDGVRESQGQALAQGGSGTPKLWQGEVRGAEDKHPPFFEGGPEPSVETTVPDLLLPCRWPSSAS